MKENKTEQAKKCTTCLPDVNMLLAGSGIDMMSAGNAWSAGIGAFPVYIFLQRNPKNA